MISIHWVRPSAVLARQRLALPVQSWKQTALFWPMEMQMSPALQGELALQALPTPVEDEGILQRPLWQR